jgi:hypothetical protein
LALGLGFALAPAPAPAGDVTYVPDWSAVEAPFYPLVPAAPVQPVLSAADIHDTYAAFVADPFIVYENSVWYMFFEVAVPLRRIALAMSYDGVLWKYERIVLSEDFHISYPLVFRADGDWYMTPESAATETVRLYRAAAFPRGWLHVADLVSGRPFADPTIFYRDGLWWMFVGDAAGETCWLYFSHLLDAEWTEHPQSPIVSGNRARARPGGRVVLLSDGRAYRIAQNGTPSYGSAARVFAIDVLTTTAYAEHEIAASPIVEASGSGWNKDGMHHVDAWWTGDHWLAAVDGIADGVWSIGVYRTVQHPTAAPPGATGMALRAVPNPTRAATTFVWLPPAATATTQPPSRLVVYEPSGRRVFARLLPAGATRSTWNGTDARGRAVAAGVYFCALFQDGAAPAVTRVVVTR